MARSLAHPFKALSRRGPAATKLGATVAEDAAARNALRFLYADVLDVFASADEYPEDKTFTAEWLATFAADACEMLMPQAEAIVGRILSTISDRRLRGNASRAGFTVRQLLSDSGIVDDEGRRVRAEVSDPRMRRILAERPERRPASRDGGRYMVASGTAEDGTRWKAMLYCPRKGGRFLNLARVRYVPNLSATRKDRAGRIVREEHDAAPAEVLPDKRTVREAVRAWSRDRARTDGQRSLAKRFLLRRQE